MSGKPREDRSAIASHHLGLRLNDDEHTQLGAIVADANEKMSEAGIPGVMTMTAMVRWLIVQEFKRRGLGRKSPAQHLVDAAKIGTPDKSKKSKR